MTLRSCEIPSKEGENFVDVSNKIPSLSALEGIRQYWIRERDKQLDCSAVPSSVEERRIHHFTKLVTRSDKRIKYAKLSREYPTISKTILQIEQFEKSKENVLSTKSIMPKQSPNVSRILCSSVQEHQKTNHSLNSSVTDPQPYTSVDPQAESECISGVTCDEWMPRFQRDDSVDSTGGPLCHSQDENELKGSNNRSKSKGSVVNTPLQAPNKSSKHSLNKNRSKEQAHPDESSLSTDQVVHSRNPKLLCSNHGVKNKEEKKGFNHQMLQPIIFLKFLTEYTREIMAQLAAADTKAQACEHCNRTPTVAEKSMDDSDALSQHNVIKSLESSGDQPADLPTRSDHATDPLTALEGIDACSKKSVSVFDSAKRSVTEMDQPAFYSAKKDDFITEFEELLLRMSDPSLSDAERDLLRSQAEGVIDDHTPFSSSKSAIENQTYESDTEKSDSEGDALLDDVVEQAFPQQKDQQDTIKNAKPPVEKKFQKKPETREDDEIDDIIDNINFSAVDSSEEESVRDENAEFPEFNCMRQSEENSLENESEDNMSDFINEEDLSFAKELFEELDSEYAQKELDEVKKTAVKQATMKAGDEGDLSAESNEDICSDLENENPPSEPLEKALDTEEHSPIISHRLQDSLNIDRKLMDQIKNLLDIDILEMSDNPTSSKRPHSRCSFDASELSLQNQKKPKKRKLLRPSSPRASTSKENRTEANNSSSDESGFAAPKSPRKTPSKREIRSDSEDIDKKKNPPVLVISSDTDDGNGPLEVSSLFASRKVITLSEQEKHKSSPKKFDQKHGRRHRIIRDEDLCAASRRAVQAERKRKKRIADLEQYDDQVLDQLEHDGIVVQISIHEALWKLLRPHQQDGVKFIYQNVVESWDYQQTEGAQYGGCILAHSMGLGKTVQVISFLQAVIISDLLDFHTALVVCPASIVLNWRDECEMWMAHLPPSQRIKVYVLTATTSTNQRLEVMKKWKKTGGILAMSYHLYSNFVGQKKTRSANEISEFRKYLQDPGPDIVICDEAHQMKNNASKCTQALNQINTVARVALTGTPLQNNLDEYWTMVNFVKPNLLGVQKEFRNRFKKPIDAGSRPQSSKQEHTAMRTRTHILHETLSACLQVKGYEILLQQLPPKIEHVIKLRMSPLQVDLYLAYIQSLKLEDGRTGIITSYKTVQLITYHPKCLKDEEANEREKVLRRTIRSERDYADEVNSNDSSVSSSEDTLPETPWFQPLLERCDSLDAFLGPKALMLREIILQSVNIGDKMLVFSDRLAVLSCIEEMLKHMDNEGLRTTDGKAIRFQLGINVLAFDGSTKQEERHRRIKLFNTCPDCHIFLLSIKAAGMGINLIGANRVVLVEPMWNPTIDRQALFRTFRYGQTKPVFVYRFVTAGIAEEKIHETQVHKSILYQRIIDEKHGKRYDRLGPDFFSYRPSPFDPAKPYVPSVPPTDIILGRLINQFPEFIVSTDNYESLLEPTEGALSYEESTQAWADYELEQDGQSNPFHTAFDNHALLHELNKNKGLGFTLRFADVSSWQNFVKAIAKHARTSELPHKPTRQKKVLPPVNDAKSSLLNFLDKFRPALALLKEAILRLPTPSSSYATGVTIAGPGGQKIPMVQAISPHWPVPQAPFSAMQHLYQPSHLRSILPVYLQPPNLPIHNQNFIPTHQPLNTWRESATGDFRALLPHRVLSESIRSAAGSSTGSVPPLTRQPSNSLVDPSMAGKDTFTNLLRARNPEERENN